MAPPLSFADIARAAKPAVVNVSTTQTVRGQGFPGGTGPFGEQDPFSEFFRHFGPPPRNFTQRSLGSGFIIDREGDVVTNAHVVKNADKILVKLEDQREFDAQVVGIDDKTDVALLKIPAGDYPVVTLGNSDVIQVGDWVVAIGNPFGLSETVTAGIVSAKERVIGEGPYDNFIQTDASINPGNSGGPLLDLRAQVVGINAAIFSQSGGNIGIGFAIPSSIAKNVVVQLKEKGRVIRGRLGVSIYPRNLTQGMVKEFKLTSKDGALISGVETDSPAAKAQIKPYDVIVQVNGQPVKNGDDLRFKIADIQPGNKVDLTIIREGKEVKATAIVDELAPERERGQIASPDKDIGVSVVALTPSTARRYDLKTTEGLLITDIRQGSEAYRENLAVGMIILEANRRKMTSVRDFEDILKNTASGGEVMLLVRQEAEAGPQDFIATVKVR